MTRLHHTAAWLALSGVLTLAGFGAGSGQPNKNDPATVAHKVPESALTTVTLTAPAVARLGLETAVVESGPAPRHRLFSGIVLPAPGANPLVVAPYDGIVLAPPGGLPTPGSVLSRGTTVLHLRGVNTQFGGLTPDQAQRVLRLEMDNARARLGRTEELAAAESASPEEVEFARAELMRAEAAYASAQSQLGAMETTAPAPAAAIVAPLDGQLGAFRVGLGQRVQAGEPLFSVTGLAPPLVRVPVFPADLEQLAPNAGAAIERFGPSGKAWVANRVIGPPTADPATATVDLYFQLEAAHTGLRPGERVAVTVTLGDAETPRLLVPDSALLTDIHGGHWVYEALSDQSFARRRVVVDYLSGTTAVLASGPPAGTRIVTTGIAELAGAEFGIGK